MILQKIYCYLLLKIPFTVINWWLSERENIFTFSYIYIITFTLYIYVLTFIKKTVPIFFIVLLGFNSFGLSFFYLAEIRLCKIKAEEYADEARTIRDKKFILFSSDTKGIERTNKTEIRVDGKMYDIVKTQTIKGKILYYTLADRDEDEYADKLTNLEKNNSAEKSLVGKTIKAYEAKYFGVKNNDHSTCLSLDRFPEIRAANEPILYPSLFKDIFSPPPDRLFS